MIFETPRSQEREISFFARVDAHDLNQSLTLRGALGPINFDALPSGHANASSGWVHLLPLRRSWFWVSIGLTAARFPKTARVRDISHTQNPQCSQRCSGGKETGPPNAINLNQKQNFYYLIIACHISHLTKNYITFFWAFKSPASGLQGPLEQPFSARQLIRRPSRCHYARRRVRKLTALLHCM